VIDEMGSRRYGFGIFDPGRRRQTSGIDEGGVQFFELRIDRLLGNGKEHVIAGKRVLSVADLTMMR
jgi:hypothetical protein